MVRSGVVWQAVVGCQQKFVVGGGGHSPLRRGGGGTSEMERGGGGLSLFGRGGGGHSLFGRGGWWHSNNFYPEKGYFVG